MILNVFLLQINITVFLFFIPQKRGNSEVSSHADPSNSLSAVTKWPVARWWKWANDVFWDLQNFSFSLCVTGFLCRVRSKEKRKEDKMERGRGGMRGGSAEWRRRVINIYTKLRQCSTSVCFVLKTQTSTRRMEEKSEKEEGKVGGGWGVGGFYLQFVWKIEDFRMSDGTAAARLRDRERGCLW